MGECSKVLGLSSFCGLPGTYSHESPQQVPRYLAIHCLASAENIMGGLARSKTIAALTPYILPSVGNDQHNPSRKCVGQALSEKR